MKHRWVPHKPEGSSRDHFGKPNQMPDQGRDKGKVVDMDKGADTAPAMDVDQDKGKVLHVLGHRGMDRGVGRDEVHLGGDPLSPCRHH